MIAQDIYDRLPVWIQNVLVSLYGYYQYRRRFAGSYGQIYEAVVQSQNLTTSEISRSQREGLLGILALARRDVPYYRARWPEISSDGTAVARDLKSLPILSKADVRKHAIELRNPSVKPFWINHTSGSTGTPLEVAVDEYSYRLSMALLAAHEATYGIYPGAARATFAGRLIQPVANDQLPLWRYNRADNQMLFSTIHLSDRTLPHYIQELRRFRPDEVIGYPSAIYVIAEYCRRTGVTLNVKPKAVVTNSETLFDWQREAIADVFDCPVADYYGTAECLVFASQCRSGRYHFNPLLSIVEVVGEDGLSVDPGEQGQLVCTTLTNTAMPLIRYRIGDDAVLAADDCPCGSHHPGVLRIVGRTDDNVRTPDGRIVGRLDHIFKGIRGIRECQIVQDRIRHLTLKVVADQMFDQAAREELVRNLRIRVGAEIEIDIELVPQIERTASGKFKGVVSLLQ